MRPGAERRRYHRFRMPVAVRVRTGNGTSPIRSVAVDISAAGIYFLMRRTLEIGSELECEFGLSPLIPGSTVLACCRGRIVRVGSRDAAGRVGIAVSFGTCEFVQAKAA